MLAGSSLLVTRTETFGLYESSLSIGTEEKGLIAAMSAVLGYYDAEDVSNFSGSDDIQRAAATHPANLEQILTDAGINVSSVAGSSAQTTIYWPNDGNGISIRDMQAWRDSNGLNDPIVIQYLNFISGALHGDLGTSYYTHSSVTSEIMMEIPTSTLRYYDNEGLLPFVERSNGGERVFKSEDLEWLYVIGCLKKAGMYEKVTDGIFLEAGGTSTDISAIKDGKVMIKNAQVGGHKLYLTSLDVRTLGIAGGSMIVVRDGAIADVGPRSAHIADREYEVFADAADICDPKVELIAPREDDQPDYAIVTCSNGRGYALTLAGAANVLGYVPADDYAAGDVEAARRAWVFSAGTPLSSARQRITSDPHMPSSVHRSPDARDSSMRPSSTCGGGR